jgi:hypothetical protein
VLLLHECNYQHALRAIAPAVSCHTYMAALMLSRHVRLDRVTAKVSTLIRRLIAGIQQNALAMQQVLSSIVPRLLQLRT